MRIRRVVIGITFAAVAGCGTEPNLPPSELWAADLMETQQLLLMTLVNRYGAVTGKGRLSYLTDTGGDELTINGSRTPDSLFLT